MVVYKSVKQIVRDMIEWAVGVGSTITDWSVGTPNRQIIEGAASEIETLNFQVKLLEKNSHIQTATGADLDEEVEERGLERLTPQKASGQVTFYRATLPSAPITIPIGTRVQAKDGTNYETTITATFLTTARKETNTEFIGTPVEGQFVLSGVAVEAVQEGEEGNQGSEELDFLVQPISNGSGDTIENVISLSPIIGGQTQESDERLRSRALRFLSEAGRGVRDFYETLAFQSDDNICLHFQDDGGLLDCVIQNANWQVNCFDGTFLQCDQFARHDRVLRARTIPRARGTGTVDVAIISNFGGGTPPQWLLDRIDAFIALKAPAGTDVKAVPQSGSTAGLVDYTPVFNVEKTNVFDGVHNDTPLKTRLLKALVNFYNTTTYNYGDDAILTDLEAIIKSVEGVNDFSITAINGSPPKNIVIGPDQLPLFGSSADDITIFEFGNF